MRDNLREIRYYQSKPWHLIWTGKQKDHPEHDVKEETYEKATTTTNNDGSLPAQELSLFIFSLVKESLIN